MGIADQIYRELKTRLEKNVYPAGSRFPSESLLADEFSVNKMTMNKVVSMLAEQKYLIRGVRGAGTRVACLQEHPGGILAYIGKIQFYDSLILRGVISEATRHHFMVITESPGIEELQSRIRLLISGGVQGIISAEYGIPSIPQDIPLFCVDYIQPPPPQTSPNVHFMNSDNFNGGLNLMNEILRRGHRQILIFSSERFVYDGHASVTPRINGFHQAMREHHIDDYEKRTFYAAPGSQADARHFLKEYLKLYPETTLIATDSDGSAELLYMECQKQGIPCPGKITLTGFGNITYLPIATVNQNPGYQGTLATRYLISYIKDGAFDSNLVSQVDTELVNTDYIPIL